MGTLKVKQQNVIMKPQDEARMGNDVSLHTMLILALACMVQKDPFLIQLGAAGSGKSWLVKRLAAVIGAVWIKRTNFTEQPYSVYGGQIYPNQADPGGPLLKGPPNKVDVPLYDEHGSDRGIYNIEEIGNGSAHSYNQFQDLFHPDGEVAKYKRDKAGKVVLDDDMMPIRVGTEWEGPMLGGFKCADNMLIVGTGNRPYDGANSKIVPLPFQNRALLTTSKPDLEVLLADLKNDPSLSLESMLESLPFRIKDVLAVKAVIEDPAGHKCATSKVTQWLEFEKRSAKHDPLKGVESYRGQQAATGRTYERAARAAMLPWGDYRSDAFEAMLIGYLGREQGEKCAQWIGTTRHIIEDVKKFKAGDHTALPDSPDKQYRFCIGALDLLCQEQEISDQGLEVALHNKQLTGWFTHDLLGALHKGVAEYLYDQCQYKGVDLAQCASASSLK